MIFLKKKILPHKQGNMASKDNAQKTIPVWSSNDLHLFYIPRSCQWWVGNAVGKEKGYMLIETCYSSDPRNINVDMSPPMVWHKCSGGEIWTIARDIVITCSREKDIFDMPRKVIITGTTGIPECDDKLLGEYEINSVPDPFVSPEQVVDVMERVVEEFDEDAHYATRIVGTLTPESFEFDEKGCYSHYEVTSEHFMAITGISPGELGIFGSIIIKSLRIDTESGYTAVASVGTIFEEKFSMFMTNRRHAALLKSNGQIIPGHCSVGDEGMTEFLEVHETTFVNNWCIRVDTEDVPKSNITFSCTLMIPKID